MIDSNIPKIPTLLTAAGLAVALLFGFALNPTPAFANPPRPCHDHDGDGLCDDDGGELPVVYDVTLTGVLNSVQTIDGDHVDAFLALKGRGKNSILCWPVPPRTSNLG